MDTSSGIAWILALALYFTPTMIALGRKKANPGATIVVNFFFGWTFVGWVVALAMAFGQREVVHAPPAPQPPQPWQPTA